MNEAETATDIAPSFIKSKYNCHASVQGYLAAGAPRSKLVMGLPLYGRGWQGHPPPPSLQLQFDPLHFRREAERFDERLLATSGGDNADGDVGKRRLRL